MVEAAMNPKSLEEACLNFGWAWGGAEMCDASSLLRNIYGSEENNVWEKAVSLIESEETNASNSYSKNNPSVSKVEVTTIIDYLVAFKKVFRKYKQIGELSENETQNYIEESISKLGEMCLNRAREGNAFYGNYLATNFPEKYSKLENERKEREEHFEKLIETDPNWRDNLPF